MIHHFEVGELVQILESESYDGDFSGLGEIVRILDETLPYPFEVQILNGGPWHGNLQVFEFGELRKLQ